jgi:deoxyhypusine synthase
MSLPTAAPQDASAAVLKPSEPVPDSAVSVQGPNFEQALDLDGLLESYKRIGFQAQSLGRAIEIVNKMVGDALLIRTAG